jgi:hypothetical protein
MTSTVQAPPVSASGLAGRRGLTLAAAACALSGGVLLLAAGRVWLRYDIPQSGVADRPATATGHVVASSSPTLGLVILAGVLVLPATRGIVRRLAGVMIALAGLGVTYLAALTIVLTTNQVPGPNASDYLNGRVTAWAWIAGVGGLVGVTGGLLTTIASRAWPSMGRRYEQGGSPSRDTSEVSMWDRLDDGDDPTA